MKRSMAAYGALCAGLIYLAELGPARYDSGHNLVDNLGARKDTEHMHYEHGVIRGAHRPTNTIAKRESPLRSK
jgi:hypothetical protein